MLVQTRRRLATMASLRCFYPLRYQQPISLKCVETAAVETMRADTLFWQSHSIDDCLYLGELERIEVQTSGYLRHHAIVFGRACLGVCLDILVHVSLKVAYHLTRNQFQLALACREVEELTGIEQRRTCYAHVYLFCSESVKL